MRIPSLLIATALLAPSTSAQDDSSPWYFQIGFGGVFSETADGVPGGSIGFDPGFSTSIAVGREFGWSEKIGLEAQVELYYQYFTVDEKDLPAIVSAVEDDAKAFAIMFNGLIDWRFTQQYSIYGGLGVGFAKEIDYSAWDSGSLSTSDTDGAAFQGLLGFAYNLGGTYDVRLGYRYFKAEPIDIRDAISGDTTELDIAQHSLEAVFRWGL